MSKELEEEVKDWFQLDIYLLAPRRRPWQGPVLGSRVRADGPTASLCTCGAIRTIQFHTLSTEVKKLDIAYYRQLKSVQFR